MKKIFVVIMMAVTLLVGVGNLQAPVYAASPTDNARDQVCKGISGQAGGNCGTGGVNINRVLKAVLLLLSTIGGVIAVIMIIISGMKYITSSGDAQAVSSAKRTLIYAVVGLVVVALSQIIVRFVLLKV